MSTKMFSAFVFIVKQIFPKQQPALCYIRVNRPLKPLRGPIVKNV